MPSLYGNSTTYTVVAGNTAGLYSTVNANIVIANIPSTNTAGLYGQSISAYPNSAQALLTLLDNNGNVNFALDPASGNTTILAYVTGAMSSYTNSNVAAYLASNVDPTIGYIWTDLSNLQTGLNSSTSNISALQTGLTLTNANVTNLQTGLNTSNTTVSGIQTGLNSANSNISNISLSVSNLQTGLNTSNTTVSGIQTGLNSANVSIINLQTGLNSANTAISTGNTVTAGLQTGLNSANATIAGVQTGLNTANTSITALQASVTTLVGEVYANSNVAAYLPTYNGQIGNGIVFNGVTQYTSYSSTPALTKGLVWYDNNNDTLAYYNSLGEVQIGKQIFFKAYNQTGSTIPAGSVVYINGTYIGQFPTIALAEANNLSTSIVIGVTNSSIANNSQGFVTISGLVSGVNTSSYSAGTDLYLSPSTPGALTSTLPTNPNYAVQVGVVISSSSSGSMIVMPDYLGVNVNNVVGLDTYTGLTGGTLTVNAQPNITSVGSLTSPLVITNTTNATGVGTGALQVSGGASFAEDVWIQGNLNVSNINTISYNPLSVQTPLVYLTATPTYPYNYDIGLYSHFIGGPANVYAHTGITRDYNTAQWVFFSNVVAEPSGNVVNLTDPNIIFDSIKVGNVNATSYLNGNAYNVTGLAYNTIISGLQTGLNTSNTTVSGIQTGLNSANTVIATKTNYSNSNIDAYLPSYSGNLTANNIVVTNLTTLGSSGVKFSDGTVQSTAYTGGGTTYGNTQVANYLAANIDPTIGYIWVDLSGLQTGLNSANSTISGVQTGLNSANTTLSTHSTTLTNLQNGLNTANSTISGVQTGLNTANASISTLNTTVTNLQTGLNTANTTASGIQTGLNTANTTLTNLQTGLNSANTSISGLQTGLNSANTTIATKTSYANSNVAAYLPTYTGNITAGNIIIASNGNMIGNIYQTSNIDLTINAIGNGNIGNNYGLSGAVVIANTNDPYFVVGGNVTYNSSSNYSQSAMLLKHYSNYTGADSIAGILYDGRGPGTFVLAEDLEIGQIPTGAPWNSNLSTTIYGALTMGALSASSGYFGSGVTYSGGLTGDTLTLSGTMTTSSSIVGGASNLLQILGYSSGSTAANISLQYNKSTSGATSPGNIYITPGYVSSSYVARAFVANAVVEYGPAYSFGTTSGTITPNAINGYIQKITLNGTLTLNAFTSPIAGQSIRLIVTQDTTGSRTLSSTMKFAGASKTLTTTANAIDIIDIFYDGTYYYANLTKGYA